MGFCTISDGRKNLQKFGHVGVPSIVLGFFLGNRLDMVSVLVLACSVILGSFLGDTALGNNLLGALIDLKDSEDGDIEYNIFGGKGRCESIVDALLLCLSLFIM